jgi:hypothetical protein
MAGGPVYQPCARCGRPFAAHRYGRCPNGHGAIIASAVLAVIGVIIWLVSAQLRSQCVAELNPFTGPGICSGLPVIAYHLYGGAVLCAVGCLIAAVIAFAAGLARR